MSYLGSRRLSLSEIFSSFKYIVPDSTFRIPDNASSNSVCPFLLRQLILKFHLHEFKINIFYSCYIQIVFTVKFSTLNTTSPSFASALFNLRRTLRPTIISASFSLFYQWFGMTNNLPLTTDTSLVKSIISLSLWVIKTIVLPSSFNDRSILNNSSTSWGVSTPVGSSRINISAPRYKDFKISTRWRKPTDRSEMTESKSIFNL